MSYGQMAGGGPSVDTILAEPNCKPGGVVAGKVHLRGGAGPAEIRQVTLALMPRMRHHGGETAGPEVYRGALTRGFRLDAGGQRDLAFSIPLPYELPFTTVLGHELPGFTIGMCTEIDVAGQPDPGDIDPISVEPLESQQWVLASIARLGFQITNVTFESSKLRGVSQQLPFHQEIHLNPPSSHQGRIEKVGLSFVASPRVMAFVLRAEDRDTPQDESFGVFKVPHAEAAETDWNAKISQWLEAAVAMPRSSRPGPAAHGTPPPPPGQAPLPPPGGHSAFPPPPPQPAAAYGGPSEYGSHGNAHFPPPAPAPGQRQPAPMADPGYAPSPSGMPPAPGPGFPPPAHSPMPGHGMPSHGAPPHGAPPPAPHGTPPPHGMPSHGTPPHGAPPPAPHGAPPPPAPPHGMPAHGAPPPAPPGPMPYAPAAHAGPPPPAPPGPAPYSPHGHPPPAPVHHGPPGYHGHRHLGHGAAAAGLVGGVAAAGVAGGMAMGALDAAGYAQNVAGYVAGAPVDAFGNALAGYAGNVAGHVIADAAGGIAGDIAGDVAGELAGGAAEILGGLLGGLFG